MHYVEGQRPSTKWRKGGGVYTDSKHVHELSISSKKLIFVLLLALYTFHSAF